MSSKLELFQLCLILIYLCINSILKEKTLILHPLNLLKFTSEYLLEMTTALDGTVSLASLLRRT